MSIQVQMQIISKRAHVFKVETYLMSFLLAILLEIGGQVLILGAIQISVFPAGLHQFHRPISNMLAVHFFQSVQEISWVSQRHKTVPPCLSSPSIPDDSCHLEGRVSSENRSQDLVIHFIAKVTTENTIVIFRPIFHSLVFPNLSCSFSHNPRLFGFFLLELLQLFTLNFGALLLIAQMFFILVCLSCLFWGLLFFDLCLYVLDCKGLIGLDVNIPILQLGIQQVLQLFYILGFGQFDRGFDGLVHLIFKLYQDSYKYGIELNQYMQIQLRKDKQDHSQSLLFLLKSLSRTSKKQFSCQNRPIVSEACSFQRQINKFSGIIYLLQLQIPTKAMNLMKVSSIKTKIHRQDPRISPNIPAYRSYSHSGFEKQNHSRKQSRTKIKKQSMQNSHVTTNLIDFNDFLFPTSEIQENSMSALTKKAQPRQNEIKPLRQINKGLQAGIGSKEAELNELRTALGAMKQKITDSHSKQFEEIKNLRQANLTLQQRFDEQAHEMQSLRREFSILREQLDSSGRFMTNMSSSNIEQSKISSRAHYPKFYQQVFETHQPWQCDRCSQLIEQIEDNRTKYGNELRRLQEQISRLKQKEIILEVLKQQINNKNECIDHLRRNMETMERKSKDFLKVVYTLENQAQSSDYTHHRTRRQFSTPKWDFEG